MSDGDNSGKFCEAKKCISSNVSFYESVDFSSRRMASTKSETCMYVRLKSLIDGPQYHPERMLLSPSNEILSILCYSPTPLSDQANDRKLPCEQTSQDHSPQQDEFL